jgi:ribonuclease HIII
MDQYNKNVGQSQAPKSPSCTGAARAGCESISISRKNFSSKPAFSFTHHVHGYELWRAYLSDCNAVAYQSGKIIAQGRYPEKVLQTIAPALLPEGGQNYDSNNSLF